MYVETNITLSYQSHKHLKNFCRPLSMWNNVQDMKRIKPKMLVKEWKVGQKNKTSKQTSLQSTDEFHFLKKGKTWGECSKEEWLMINQNIFMEVRTSKRTHENWAEFHKKKIMAKEKQSWRHAIWKELDMIGEQFK